MERMVALARSVGAFARFRQESDDGVKWPVAPLDIARMLCTEVRQQHTGCLLMVHAWLKAVAYR